MAERVFVIGGQSNGASSFNSPDTGQPNGRDAFLSTINTIFPNSTNTLVNGATGSSAAAKSSTLTDIWWYDNATGNFGAAYATWLTNVTPHIGKIQALLWDQGETDSTGMGQGNTTRAETVN